LWRKLKETEHLENPVLGGNIKRNLTRKGGQVRHWIILAHDRGKEGTLLNAVINPLVLQNVKNSITKCKTVDGLRKQSALWGVLITCYVFT
jgi:hypothetical protein